MTPGTPPNPANEVEETTTASPCDEAATTAPTTPPKAPLSASVTTDTESATVVVLEAEDVVVIAEEESDVEDTDDAATTPAVPPNAPFPPIVNDAPPVAASVAATTPGSPPNAPLSWFAESVTTGSDAVVGSAVDSSAVLVVSAATVLPLVPSMVAVTMTTSVRVTVMVESVDCAPVTVGVVVLVVEGKRKLRAEEGSKVAVDSGISVPMMVLKLRSVEVTGVPVVPVS